MGVLVLVGCARPASSHDRSDGGRPSLPGVGPTGHSDLGLLDGGVLDPGFDAAGGGLDAAYADFASSGLGDLGSMGGCTHGPGFVAWRFHYGPSGTNAILDVYNLPDSTGWEAVPVYTTSLVDSSSALEIASSNYILIRYSVVGLTTINSATVSVLARSYSTSTSGSFNAWSPLYRDDATAPDAISVYPYAWTSVDFTGHVKVGDSPGLTGIRLYAGPGSSDLAIRAVELCISGS
jgi:hypothetical protein